MKYASLESTSETSHLANLTTASFWVGVTDVAQEGVFKNFNSGNDATSFLTWASGEPNNANEKEDCVLVTNQLFYDYDCEKFMRVLCELEIPVGVVNIIENLVEIEPPTNLFDFVGTSGRW